MILSRREKAMLIALGFMCVFILFSKGMRDAKRAKDLELVDLEQEAKITYLSLK